MFFFRLFPAYSSRGWPVTGLQRVLATLGMSWVIPTIALPQVAFIHVGFPRALATHGALWVSPAAPLPRVAILHVGFPCALAAHGVLWVSSAALLLRVALFHVDFLRADFYSHLLVGLLIRLLLWDCGQTSNKVSATLVTNSGSLLSIFKSLVKDTSSGLSSVQLTPTVLGRCLRQLHL